MPTHKHANTIVEINSLIAQRWSGRSFNPEKEIHNDALLALLEASRWSPSCYGEQPWHFIVFNRFDDNPAWQQALSTLNESNAIWAKRAPVLILVTANTLFSANGKPNQWASYDTGASVMSLSLQATAEGLMTHQIGGFNADKVRAQFNLPENINPLAIIALGYPAPGDNLPETLAEKEAAPRHRNPISQNFFRNQWGQGFNE